jgi:hypothetical protein
MTRPVEKDLMISIAQLRARRFDTRYDVITSIILYLCSHDKDPSFSSIQHTTPSKYSLNLRENKMADEYAGKSDEQIIAEQAGSLASKDNYQSGESYNPRSTQMSEESNINESGAEGFPGATFSIGRTGQTGGGTNAQNIPPEEGGLDKSQVQGESSDRFEGSGDADDKRREVSVSFLWLDE